MASRPDLEECRFLWIRSCVVRHTILGVAFGSLFPLLAVLVEVWQAGLPWSLSSVWRVQADSILLWIIDSAPLFLGLAAWQIGRKQEELRRLNRSLKESIINRTAERDEVSSNLDQALQKHRLAEEQYTAANRSLQQRLDNILSIQKDHRAVTLLDLIDINRLQKLQDTFSDACGLASLIVDLEGVSITEPSR
ncbi:MAG: PocR ligand-binding domain-containing protein, partial [candidate division Zixibacteria bacterium]|nr:PocR ligand-binding domain-containing protein [candidate division Zixibacteria bacterium]